MSENAAASSDVGESTLAPPAAFDTIASTYDATRGGEIRGRRFAARIAPMLLDGPSLEMGVGTGVVATALRSSGRSIVGFDISGEMVRVARSRLPGLVFVADAHDIPVQSGAVDNVIAVWVLHMVADLSRVVTEVARVIKTGGRLITCSVENSPTDPIGDVVSRMRAELLRRSGGEEPDSRARLSDALNQGGFSTGTMTSSVDQEYTLAPAEMAQTLANRGFSSLKTVGARDWEDVVQPAIDALMRFEHPERPILRTTSHQILSFERTPSK